MIILAPNAFKGTLTAPEICQILSEELSDSGKIILSLPLGDGGDGTAEIIAGYLQASPVKITTCDALGRTNESFYYTTPNRQTAIIELAEICGLKHLTSEEHNVLQTDTSGFGKAINHAVRAGARRLLLCVGGSASIDGGIGALKEMGLHLVTTGSEFRNKLIEIKDFNSTHIQNQFKDIQVTILCDVENTLCGKQGAAHVFGPQKGATPLQVLQLDNYLNHWADLIQTHTSKDIRTITHGGAAGGITASFSVLLNAILISGADYNIQLSGFRDHLQEADLVITGEGKIDEQSLCGKIPGTIASLCREQRVPVIAIAGAAHKNITAFDHIFTTISCAPDIAESIKHPAHYLRLLCKQLKVYLQNN